MGDEKKEPSKSMRQIKNPRERKEGEALLRDPGTGKYYVTTNPKDYARYNSWVSDDQGRNVKKWVNRETGKVSDKPRGGSGEYWIPSYSDLKDDEEGKKFAASYNVGQAIRNADRDTSDLVKGDFIALHEDDPRTRNRRMYSTGIEVSDGVYLYQKGDKKLSHSTQSFADTLDVAGTVATMIPGLQGVGLIIKAGTTLASGAIRRTNWKDTATQVGIDVGSAWLAGKIPGVQGTQGAVQAGFSQGISAGTRAILSEGVKGAVRGAVQEGVSSAAGQQIREGEIDYKEVGKAATRGAVSGFVAPTVAAGVDWLSAVPAPGDQSPISGTGGASLPGSIPAPGDPTGQIVDLEGIKDTPRTAQVPSPPAFDTDAFTPPAPEAPAAPAPEASAAPAPEAPAKPGEVTQKDILDEVKRSGKANEDFRERQLYWGVGIPAVVSLVDLYLGYQAGKSQEDALEQAQRDRDRAYQEHRDTQNSVAEQYFSSVRENTVPDWGVSGATVWN